MQQINLYVPELRPKRDWLTANSLVAFFLVFCLLMLTAVAVNIFQLKKYEAQVVRLESQRALSEQQVKEIKVKTPVDATRRLDAEIEGLRLKIHQRVQISELIGGQNLGNRDGFSLRFDTMAENVSSDIALTRFRFSEGLVRVELLGESKSAASIADMVGRLKSEESFEKASFGSLTMRNNKAISDRVYFSFGFAPLFNSEEQIAGQNQ